MANMEIARSSIKAMLTLILFVKSLPKPEMPDLSMRVVALPYLILSQKYDADIN